MNVEEVINGLHKRVTDSEAYADTLKIQLKNAENDITGLGYRVIKLESMLSNFIIAFGTKEQTLWGKLKSFSAKTLTGVSWF